MNDLTTPEPDDNGEQRENDRYTRALESHVAQLAEHFGTVEIFVTRETPEGTTLSQNRGSGNWYARFAQAAMWVEREKERERDGVRKYGNE